MEELFLQAGAVGVVAAVSYKSLDLAVRAVESRFNGRRGKSTPESAVVAELQKLNSQVGTFLKEQAHHIGLSESTHSQVKKNEELIDQVNRDVLLLKRDGRE